MNKKISFLSIVAVFLLTAVSLAGTNPNWSKPEGPWGDSGACIKCHKSTTPAVYGQWLTSKHYGAYIGCYECHGADKSDKDAFKHNGKLISVIVSPKDCSKCHESEVSRFSLSGHSRAADLVMTNKLGIFFGDYVTGDLEFMRPGFPGGVSAAGVNGCWKCHGYKINVNKKGEIDPATWPNKGIGRINPDGSRGNCGACHSAHGFSSAQARRPESCSGCHTGSSSHYIYDIYKESRHGINYYTNKDKMNLDSPGWVPGETYFAAPTCATCHMSATMDMAVTHNVSLRINPKQEEIINEKMGKVCSACHYGSFVGNFKLQYKGETDFYNRKWITPGTALYCKAQKVLRALEGKKFRDLTHPIDYTWFDFSGSASQARIAAAMMGQFYVDQSNIAFAKIWFSEFVPGLKEIIKMGKKSQSPEAQKHAIELEKLLKETLSKPTYGPGWPQTDIFGCQ
jgi:hypothetical protein